MRFVHAADIHLDSPLQNLALQDEGQAARVRRACRDAFESMVRFCIDRRVSFLVLAGDLYDGDNTNMQTAYFLRQQLARLDKAGIRVVILKGNHDAQNRITGTLGMPDNTWVFDDKKPQTISFDDLQVAFHGQSFRPGPVPENLAARYPKPIAGWLNIGVLHTSLAGSDQHDPYAPCRLEDLTTHGYAYWALGHIHKGSVLAKAPWVVYSGNIQGRDIRETGPKGCYLVETDGDRVLSAEHIAFDVIRWHQADVDLTGATHEEDMADRIRASLREAHQEAGDRPCIVRLRLTGQTELHSRIGAFPNRLRDTVLGIAADIALDEIWLEKIRNETQPAHQRAKNDNNDSTSDLLRIIHEVAQDVDLIGPALKDALKDLRMKLPEELKQLPALELIDNPALARDFLMRLEPRIAARLNGEDVQ